ncbi:MAG: DUF3108 domain-containing protein [Casimicrobiaceae bacterium]
MSPAIPNPVPAIHALKPSRVAGPRPWQPRRVFVLALLLSVAVHFAATLWPEPQPEAPETPPLQATLKELPPPPPKATVATPPKPRASARARTRRPAPPFVPVLPGPLPANLATSSEGEGSDSLLTPAPMLPSGPIAAAAEPLLAPPALELKTLPPRVDLVYRVFWGTQGFFIGDATYRFEHSGDRYRIATVGEARGLAALILRGQGKLESEGSITVDGLQPEAFALVRGKGRKREVARFDWDARTVTLEGDKSEPLTMQTFDPLAFLWQFYFLPPTADRETFAIATTKRLYQYTFTREGTESIETRSGSVETQRWHRRSDDGKTDAYVWLAPTLHYVAVKLRFSNTDRGTLEAVLDAIRVDEAAVAQQ